MFEEDDMGRRAVAIVNACAGISTEALESGCITELVRCLEAWVNPQVIDAWMLSPINPDDLDLYLRWSRAALARVKGQEVTE